MLSRPPLLLLECPLAGFQYHSGEAHWSRLKPNDRVTLRRDPGNRHDARAIAVEWQGVMLGYVPREANFAVSQMLDRGERVEGRIARLQSTQDPWKRVGLELFAYPRQVSAEAPQPRTPAPAPPRPLEIPMPMKSATVPWHKMADPPPGDDTFYDALRVLMLCHGEIGRRLALPASAVTHLGRRTVRLWEAIEISVAESGHDLRARFLDSSSVHPKLAADLTTPVGELWSSAFVPYLGRVCDELQVPRKAIAGAAGRWIHASLRNTFRDYVDFGELRRRLLDFLAPDVLARSLTNRIFDAPPGAEDFNWVAAHKEAIALSAIEHPRLLPFLRFLRRAAGDGLLDPAASLRAHFIELGMAPAAFARIERWGFDAFVAFDPGEGEEAALLEPQAVVDYANLLLDVDAGDAPPALFGRLAARAAAREMAAPDWVMRALLRATIQAGPDAERLPLELDDALDWVAECDPQPDANQRKSGWPWIVEQSRAYVAKRDAQCWPLPCGEIRVGPIVAVPLRNAAELREEAAEMHNCLDKYVATCMGGHAVVFSMRNARTGKRLACFLAECVLEPDRPGKWAIAEIKGKMNQPAEPRLLALATIAMSKLNGSASAASR
jgi:hypothetical protein